MKKTILAIIASFFLITFVQAQIAQTGRLSIAVTFNAMEELTRAVVGDLADISLIIPEGMEPHEAEPTPQNLIFLSNADVLVYNGLGMEFYLEKTLEAVMNKNLTLVEASKGITPIKLEEDNEHEEEHEGHHHHHHGTFDPHAWLSLNSAKIMVKNIEVALSKLDKKNAKQYSKNASQYIKKLDKLFKEYKKKFSKMKGLSLVASHAAFAYLCRDFGLLQNSIHDVFAEGEPNAKQMVELVEYCKKNNVKAIFSEELANPALAETLSKEVGGKVIKIYTLEGKEEGLDYFSRMQENLKRIFENIK